MNTITNIIHETVDCFVAETEDGRIRVGAHGAVFTDYPADLIDVDALVASDDFDGDAEELALHTEDLA